jgi:hypothetical protein
MLSSDSQAESPGTPLILAGVAFGISLILRQVPVLAWLIYPFQLFVALVHELSHGLAALLTGGRFIEFIIAPDASGLAVTAGGWRWFIIPAGYLGAALLGCLLLLLTHRAPGPRQRQWLALGLGFFFALMTLLFGRNLMAVTVGGLAAVALLGLGLYGPPLPLMFGLNLLAIQCVLNALDSLMGLMRLNAGPFQSPNDARAMADLTRVPALFWAILWSLAAVAMLVGSVYLSLRRGESA